MPRELDAEIDRIYAAPLADFTTCRNELADRLKQEGKSDAARSIRALSKPPLSAWAVNTLWHHERAAFDALLQAGDSVRTATKEGDFSGGHRDAMAQRRAAIDRLLKLAQQHLEEHGHSATKATLRKIQTSLDAVAGHGLSAMQPAPGRIDADLEPAGFGALAAFGLPAAAAQSPELAAARDKLERLRASLSQTRRAVERTRSEWEEASKRAKEARAIEERAQQEHEDAIKKEKTLRGEIAALEQDIESP